MYRVLDQLYVNREWKELGEEMFAPGFYFVDETSAFNGPYSTLEEAQAALQEYVEHLL